MRGGLMIGTLVVVVLTISADGGAQDYRLRLPRGLQEQAMNLPADNPPTPEKIALGKQLFFDNRWSKGQTVSCSSCHQAEKGWGDGRQFSMNFAGKPTPRHAPTIINRLFSDLQLWTGLRKSLEDQAYNDGNTSPEAVVQNLGQIKGYQEQFRKVFGTGVTAEGAGKAIAAYVRTILSGDSPYDRFQAGERTALSPVAQRGLALFGGKARCVRCHTGFNFTDEGYHNLGVGMEKENPDLGRYLVTKQEADKGAFKTPTLRDATLSAPYLHDGSKRTLREVVDFYNRGGIKNPWLSKEITPLNLTAEEQADLVAFLEALTGKVSPEVGTPPTLPQ